MVIPRLLLLNLVISMLALELVAQSPTPSASGTAPVLDDKLRKSSPAAPASTPAPGGAPTPAKFVATPSPSPTATLSTEALINSLNAADLRASTTTTDFGIASDFAKRFCPKGKTLFTLHKASKQDRAFTSDRDPAYQGLIIVLTDAETSGGAEIIAAALRFYDKALLIGQATAGRAVEYSDLPLPSGKLLRVAASEALSADGHSLYPAGVKPDLPVEMSMVDKRYVFQLSMEKGLGPFIYEAERPHMNEAALIAGTNPELESAEQRRGRMQDRSPRDAVLQRALDLVT